MADNTDLDDLERVLAAAKFGSVRAVRAAAPALIAELRALREVVWTLVKAGETTINTLRLWGVPYDAESLQAALDKAKEARGA